MSGFKFLKRVLFKNIVWIALSCAWNISNANQTKTQVKIISEFNTDKLYLIKITKRIKHNGGSLLSTYNKANTNKVLYQLGGLVLKKPLAVRQWAYSRKIDRPSNTPDIHHRFMLINNQQILIDQFSHLYGLYECRVYNVKSRRLVRPKECLQTEYAISYYSKIEKNLYLVRGGAEGTQDFAVTFYTPEQGKKYLLYLDLTIATLNNESYKNGIVRFISSCNIIDEYYRLNKKMPTRTTKLYKCKFFNDRYTKEHKFKWSKLNGLQYDR